ncbi:MAG: HAMP domain-containing histidine kinase, partial [Cyclobacteriaceae bacterium]|nr:HAMP domain-containing histidine kinase [Cyclobacteriaceae bacterium]
SNIEGNHMEEFSSLRQQDELYANASIHLVDSGWKLFEKTLEPEMDGVINNFRGELNALGGDINLLNMTEIQNNLGQRYDYYVINKSGIIVKTTYELELGFDLSGFYSTYSQRIFESNETVFGRINTEILTGEYRKFAFLASLDSEYILELSLASSEFVDITGNYNYLIITPELEQINPYLENVRVLDGRGYMKGNPEFQPTDEFRQYIDHIITSGQNHEVSNSTTNTLVSYVFIDLLDEDYIGANSLVVELTYNLNLLESEIAQEKYQLFVQGVVVVSILLLGSFVMSRMFSKPLKQIVEGVNQIGKSNQNHQIEINALSEFSSLAKTINQMATDLRFSQTALHKRQRIESLGVLAGGIAHDFNNILTIILGNVSILFVECEEEYHAFLTEIKQAVFRAQTLTHQLLTFSKGGDPIKKGASIVDIIHETANFVSHGADLEFKYQFPEDLWSVKVDKGQIGQVFQNIVLNAIQASIAPNQVKLIDITAKNTILPPDNNLSIKDGPYISISVKDFGIGIPVENLDKIFDPYFSTKESGHGLGLAICYSIIEKHGGTIIVESEINKGTTFTIVLPAQPTSELLK